MISIKIEPRKIKKTLKYAAVGTCVAASLVTAGCNSVEVAGDIAITPTPEEKLTLSTPPQEAGVIVAPTSDTPDMVTPDPDELYLDGDIATTPELAGGIPTPFDEEYELDPSGAPPVE